MERINNNIIACSPSSIELLSKVMKEVVDKLDNDKSKRKRKYTKKTTKDNTLTLNISKLNEALKANTTSRDKETFQ